MNPGIPLPASLSWPEIAEAEIKWFESYLAVLLRREQRLEARVARLEEQDKVQRAKQP